MAKQAPQRAAAGGDLNLRVIAGVAAVVATVVVGAAALGYAVRDLFPHPHEPGPVNGPALAAAPQAELQAFRAQKQALLSGYAWIDRQNETARIPIARAMELLVRERPQDGAKQ